MVLYLYPDYQPTDFANPLINVVIANFLNGLTYDDLTWNEAKQGYIVQLASGEYTLYFYDNHLGYVEYNALPDDTPRYTSLSFYDYGTTEVQPLE